MMIVDLGLRTNYVRENFSLNEYNSRFCTYIFQIFPIKLQQIDKIPVKISAKIQPPYESVAHSNGSSSTSSLS